MMLPAKESPPRSALDVTNFVSDVCVRQLVLRLGLMHLREVLDSKEAMGHPVFETDQDQRLSHYRQPLLALVNSEEQYTELLQPVALSPRANNFPRAVFKSRAFQSLELVLYFIVHQHFENSKFIFCFLSFVKRYCYPLLFFLIY